MYLSTGVVAFADVATLAMVREEANKKQVEKAEQQRLLRRAELARIQRETDELAHAQQLEHLPIEKRFAIVEVDIPIDIKPKRRWRLAATLILIACVLVIIWQFVGSEPALVRKPPATPTPPSQLPAAVAKLSPALPSKTVPSHPGGLLKRVVMANKASIENVLLVAETGDQSSIASAATTAGRAFSFGSASATRDRKRARQLNDQALQSLKQDGDREGIYRIQQQAFQVDSLDSEIAGNLAIYALRAGRNVDAMEMAIYALSLPRNSDKTGRTADWATLAASYAAIGDHKNARAALYVTLAITPDITKRCYSAVYSVKNTYGPALKQATEAMFARIRDKELSRASECSLPIAW